MFEENDTVVETTENTVEQPVEEVVDESLELTDTSKDTELNIDEEVERRVNERIDQILPKKINRERRKIEKEFEKKYGKVEPLLKASTGTESLDEAVENLEEIFKEKGIEVPAQRYYNERELKVLADAEAKDIIDDGYDAICEELDRLSEIGTNNMSSKDKMIFMKLAKERRSQEDIKALATIGVKADVLEDKDFKDFANNLNDKLSQKEKYEMYLKYAKPKKETQKMGSMSGTGKQELVKDTYTNEEIAKMSLDDLSDPKLFEAVRKSMTRKG